jgi:enoyl reductase-like protein
MPFDYTDKAVSYIDKQIIARFSTLKSVLSFDEINAMTVIEKTNAVYKDINKTVRKVYLQLANKLYREYVQRTKDLKSLDEEWVDAILEGYDPVTMYVFDHEIDRKAARCIETIIASKADPAEIDREMRGIAFQCRMYADRITDEAVMQAYKHDKVRKVRWRAENDTKTCKICESRDGKIYPIDKVPADPHPLCRCWRERVNG